MEYIGYIILTGATIAWLYCMSAEIIDAFPFGTIVLAFILGCGFLFAKALKDRLSNKEDDRYSKEVDR